MGRKKRNVPTRSKTATPPAADSHPPQCSIGGDGDVSSVTTEQSLRASSSATQEEHPNQENEILSAIESDDYSALKFECKKALNALRRGNHTKALKLLKDMCAKHENNAFLGLIHRVQGTVHVKVASIIDDPNVRNRHLKNALDSAKKAAMYSPNSAEFALFYANLLYETANDRKDYEESVRECERALAIKNPIELGKEGLGDENETPKKISTEDARMEHVQNGLRALLQKANLGTISGSMKNLGNAGEKFRIVPTRRPPDDPNIKKATKSDEERRKEIEVKVLAARLLQQKQTEGDKGSEPSSGSV